MQKTARRSLCALVILVAGLPLVGCGRSEQAGPPGGMPAAAVGVVTVQTTRVDLNAELPGRLEALRTAQVRARVAGVIRKRLFTEGATVRAGQPLFEIDGSAYRAALDSALAGQARAEAVLFQAQATLERNRPLLQAQAISQQEWLAAETAHKQATADLATAKAAVTQARLNVEYTQVLAPISGRIGRANVTEGALVSPSEATLLATIQQVDPLYVNISQSATDVMRLRRSIEAGRVQPLTAVPVQVVLDDGSAHSQPGRLLFADLTVDATTGQVLLRAEVPNPRGDLLPGLYVRVRLAQAQTDQAMLLPQQAVTRAAAGDSVLVVGADGQVAPRIVQLGGSRDNQWIVLDGLKPGEQVVVDGFQKIRPKTPVKPVPWTPGGASAPASAAVQ